MPVAVGSELNEGLGTMIGKHFESHENAEYCGPDGADQIRRKRYPVHDGFTVPAVYPHVEPPSTALDFLFGETFENHPEEQCPNDQKECCEHCLPLMALDDA